MEYLWQDYDEKNFYYAKNEMSAPYLEKCGVFRAADGARIEINPLIRFAAIFRPLIDAVETDDELHHIEDLLFHFLARLDLQCATHDFTLVEDNIRRELESGCYGERVARRFNRLTSDEQSKIVSLLRRQEHQNGRRLLFDEAIHSLFSGALLWFYEDEQRFLVHLPLSESDAARDKLELIRELFHDFIGNEPKIFWNAHFGIIGKPQTMRLDRVILY